MSDSAAISCERLVRRFGSFTAVHELSMGVKPGEVFGLLGANGSGKSTTIRMLTGILPPTSGAINVAGVDVVADPLEVRSRLGYVAQKVSLYPNLRIHENIAFYGGIYGLAAAEVRARAQELAPRLGLERAVGRALARELPAGVRQRLAILLALLHKPRVLFLDEPTAGVDLANRRALFDLMHELSQEGMALLITSHHLDEMEHCTRLAFIDGGKLLGCGSPDELKETLGGGRRIAVYAPSLGPERLLAALAEKGFRSEVADATHEGAVFVFVASYKEQAHLADVLAKIPGASLHVSPPTLESVFAKTVAERRRADEEARKPAHAEGPR